MGDSIRGRHGQPWGELSGGRTDGPSGYTYGAVAVRGTDQRDRLLSALRSLRFSGWVAPPAGRLGARCRVPGGRCSGPPPAGLLELAASSPRSSTRRRSPSACSGTAAGARRLVRSRRGRPLPERSRLRVGRRGRAAVPDRLRARRGLRGCARGAAGRRRARGAARRGARPRQRDRVGGTRRCSGSSTSRAGSWRRCRCRTTSPAARGPASSSGSAPASPACRDCSSGGRPRFRGRRRPPPVVADPPRGASGPDPWLF